MVTYKDSGVDLKAADAAVEQITNSVRSTYSPRVLPASHGSFAGMFLLDYPPGLLRRSYKQPVLLASTDGVGTKLDIAFRTGIADSIGIDLVAMCVNDIVVHGAEPLFFLDYIAVGKLRPQLVADIVKGIAKGCLEAGCAILGGETAEMPGFYAPDHYDVAGFTVGVAEKSRLITGRNVRAGDQVIGLLSSGIHSNGYSLVRKIFFSRNGSSHALDSVLDGCELPLGAELLRPTRIYVKPILSLLRKYRVKRPIKALAHITGSGLPGNCPRVLPRDVDLVIRRSAWDVPPIFRHLQSVGKVPEAEMYRVFNMGIGMVMVVSRHFLDSVMDELAKSKTPAVHLGEIVSGTSRVRFR